MEEVTLQQLPSTSKLMAKALLTGIGRPSPSQGLPQRSVALTSKRQDRERLAAYCRVTGFGIRDAVPATWLHVLTFPLHLYLMGSKDFPFPLPGIVHASNEMRLHRSVLANEPLRIQVQADNMVPHKRGIAFELLGTIRVADEVVWSGTSTYLAMGKTLTGTPPQPARRLEAPRVPRSQRWRLSADLGRKYAQVSGDHNPIHLRRVSSLPFGFSRPIIHGMWTYAKSLASLGPELPEAHVSRVAFTKPIPLPNRVGFTTSTEPDGTHFAVINSGDGKPYLVGEVSPLL